MGVQSHRERCWWWGAAAGALQGSRSQHPAGESPALLPLSGIPWRVPWVPAPKELLASPPADAELGQHSQPAALPVPAASGARLQPARVAMGTRQVILSGGLHTLPASGGASAASTLAAAHVGTV